MSKAFEGLVSALAAKELQAEELSFHCRKEELIFETTATVEPLQGMIGQNRAVTALSFGLHTKNSGYNIFVSGMVGTGRMTYARQVVEELALKQQIPSDWCYVNNFEDAGRPVAVSLPAGTGALFCQKIKELIENLRNDVSKAFSSEDYERERTEIMKAFQENRSQMLQTFVENSEEYSVLSKW